MSINEIKVEINLVEVEASHSFKLHKNENLRKDANILV